LWSHIHNSELYLVNFIYIVNAKVRPSRTNTLNASTVNVGRDNQSDLLIDNEK
jgi:hypothetical protein